MASLRRYKSTETSMAIERQLSKMNYCKECDGWGEVTVEVAKPHGFNRDVGYLDTDKQTCEACKGTGEQTNE